MVALEVAEKSTDLVEAEMMMTDVAVGPAVSEDLENQAGSVVVLLKAVMIDEAILVDNINSAAVTMMITNDEEAIMVVDEMTMMTITRGEVTDTMVEAEIGKGKEIQLKSEV